MSNNNNKDIVDDLRAKMNKLWSTQQPASTTTPLPTTSSKLTTSQSIQFKNDQVYETAKKSGGKIQLSTTSTKDMSTRISEFRAYLFLLRQEEAKQWMSEVIKEPIQEDDVFDFMEQLRDGQLLCKLASQWTTIAKIHKVPFKGHKLEFMMATDNLNSFFDACRKIGFPNIYNFSVPDLWERKNVAAVVHFLHALAHFLDRMGIINVKIKDLSASGIQFDKKKLEKYEQEFSKLDKDPLALLDFDFNKKDKKKDTEPSLDDLFKKYGYLQFDAQEPDMDSEMDTFASADHTLIEGLGAQQAVAGQLTKFNIVSRSSSNKDLSMGGENFECDLIHLETGELIRANIKDLANGRYEVSYVAKKAGPYRVDIRLDHTQKLKNCPIRPLQVRAAGEIDKIDIVETENFDAKAPKFFAGQTYKCKIQCKDSYGNVKMDNDQLQLKLTLDEFFSVNSNAEGVTETQKDKYLYVKDVPDANGLYEVSFMFPAAGQYDLDLKCQFKASPNSNELTSKSIPLIQAKAFIVQEPPQPVNIKVQNAPETPFVAQYSSTTVNPNLKKFISLLFAKPAKNKQSVITPAVLESILKSLFPKWMEQSQQIRAELFQNSPEQDELYGTSDNEDMYWKYVSVLGKDLLQEDLKQAIAKKLEGNPTLVLSQVQLSDELMDWTDYEKLKFKEMEQLIEQQKKLQQPKVQPPPVQCIDPNAFTIRPRTCAINFWVIVSYMINNVKQTVKPYIRDPQGAVTIFENKSISYKQFLHSQFNVVRKSDIKKYCDILLPVTQRFVFEVLHEFGDLWNSANKTGKKVALPVLTSHHLQQLTQISKECFNRLKNIHQVVELVFTPNKGGEQFIKGINFWDEMDDAMKEQAKEFILSLKRQYMLELLNGVQFMKDQLFAWGITESQINDYSLMSTFFKTNLADVSKGYDIVFGYEMSNRNRPILVHEIQLLTPYKPQQAVNSYAIYIPLNNLFDQYLYQSQFNRSVRDRARPGLVNPYKTVYIKNGSVMFEGFRSASISTIGIDDSVKRLESNLQNAMELLQALAANHCKRFTRLELTTMMQRKESLVIPFTSVSLLTPFFLNEREDRQLVEHQLALLDAMVKVTQVTVDLHDGIQQPIIVPIRFDAEKACLLNFGTNPIMKTLMMGLGIQRCMNNRIRGMRAFERKVRDFLIAVIEAKQELRRDIIQHMSAQISTASRTTSMYKQVLGDYSVKLENNHMLLMQRKEQASQKTVVMDMELKQKQAQLEIKISKNWQNAVINQDVTTVEFYFQTQVKSLVYEIEALHDKIFAVELSKGFVEKMDECILLEERFINEMGNIMFKDSQQTLQQSSAFNKIAPKQAAPQPQTPAIQPHPRWNEYYELVYKERDLWALFSDLLVLYHVKKAHESFAQGVVETEEVKRIDPYAVPVRVLMLSYLIGEEVHFNCKSGKERSGEAQEQCFEFAEIRAQFGEYWPSKAEKKTFNEHRRTIHTALALNGGGLDVIKENVGILGSKIDKAISGRFLPGYFQKYKGMNKFDRLTYANSDALWKKVCTKLAY